MNLRAMNCAVYGHAQRRGFIHDEEAVHSHCAWCGRLYRDAWWDRLYMAYLIWLWRRALKREYRALNIETGKCHD